MYYLIVVPSVLLCVPPLGLRPRPNAAGGRAQKKPPPHFCSILLQAGLFPPAMRPHCKENAQKRRRHATRAVQYHSYGNKQFGRTNEDTVRKNGSMSAPIRFRISHRERRSGQATFSLWRLDFWWLKFFGRLKEQPFCFSVPLWVPQHYPSVRQSVGGGTLGSTVTKPGWLKTKMYFFSNRCGQNAA